MNCRHEKYYLIPSVVLAQTAYGLAGDREKAIEAGCNEYIAKPVNITRLNNLIKKLFI